HPHGDGSLAPDARGIGEHVRSPLELEPRIDGVAGGAGDRADYEALLAEESVDQGALADVRATHDRQANRPLALLFGLLLDGKRLGQGADHRIEKSGYAAAVLGGDGGDVGNSQRVELGQMAAQL